MTFDRAIKSVTAETDEGMTIYKVVLNCGHHSYWMTEPAGTKSACARCIEAYLEKLKRRGATA